MRKIGFHGGPTVAAGFVHGMLSGMLANDERARCLAFLATESIDARVLEEPGLRVPLDRYAALYNAITAALGDEGFGLFSQPLRPGCYEFLCRSALYAPDLRTALARMQGFLSLVLPDLKVTLTSDQRRVQLGICANTQWKHHAPDEHSGKRNDPRRVFAYEWLLRLLHGLSSWLVGRGLVFDRVDFPYRPPAHHADYALIYTADSRFSDNGPDSLQAEFSSNLLSLPLRRDEESLQAFFIGGPGKIATLYRRDRNTVLRVRDLLRASLPDLPSLAALAESLHLSQRTLHRRLSEEGSSYRAIKDALRRDLAISRVSKSTASISEIAAGLGFADPSTFYRAFIGWTGVSPQQYRRTLDIRI